MIDRTPTNSPWVVAEISTPTIWSRSQAENWHFNPPNRYVLNAENLEMLHQYVSGWTDLKSSSLYRHLNGNSDLARKNILIERHRDRGIGDILFTTGPLRWLRKVSGHTCNIYYYSAFDKSPVLYGNPDLAHKSPMVGPIIYETLGNYDYHWMIESATEYSQEKNQPNVYDALYRQIGVDPTLVSQKYKIPYLELTPADSRDLENFSNMVRLDRGLDLSRQPYYVVAPLANSNLRSMPYQVFVALVSELAKKYPVAVVGYAKSGLMPTVDMPFADFHGIISELAASERNVINLMGDVNLRLTCSLIGGARGIVSLDSGLLYVAEALRVPAVSIWGTHHPRTRIGYDPGYMELAVWKGQECPKSPCYAHAGFPKHQCPSGENQRVCAPLAGVTLSDIMQKIELIEKSTTVS